MPNNQKTAPPIIGGAVCLQKLAHQPILNVIFDLTFEDGLKSSGRVIAASQENPVHIDEIDNALCRSRTNL